jgi:hypothetical protein
MLISARCPAPGRSGWAVTAHGTYGLDYRASSNPAVSDETTTRSSAFAPAAPSPQALNDRVKPQHGKYRIRGDQSVVENALAGLHVRIVTGEALSQPARGTDEGGHEEVVG